MDDVDSTERCGEGVQPPVGESAALRDVRSERERQQAAEGWSPEHDDQHDDGALALAAACYAKAEAGEQAPRIWPWSIRWWKPSSRRRNLVKAGALILAEIERLDRAASK